MDLSLALYAYAAMSAMYCVAGYTVSMMAADVLGTAHKRNRTDLTQLKALSVLSGRSLYRVAVETYNSLPIVSFNPVKQYRRARLAAACLLIMETHWEEMHARLAGIDARRAARRRAARRLAGKVISGPLGL